MYFSKPIFGYNAFLMAAKIENRPNFLQLNVVIKFCYMGYYAFFLVAKVSATNFQGALIVAEYFML